MTSQPADKDNKPAAPAKKPGGLLDQYRLLGAIIDTSWATRLDHKVARHIIDRYYPKHGNGRASLRYLERATGASRSNVVASLRRLAEQGAIALVRQGQGTRPSEYSLNFGFPTSVPADVTSGSGGASVPAGTTSGGHVGDTSSGASVPTGVTESYLLNPAYKAEIQIDRFDPAAPTAPPLADGLAATAAGGAAEEEGAALADAEPTFDLLWRTYGKERAGGKKEARAAWNALPPETDLAAVIEAAAAWQQSWAAQGKPDAPRFTLARWLKDERYDEDAPTGYQPKERPAKSGNQKSDNPAKPRKAKATHAFAEGETRLEIIKADVVEGETSSRLVLTLSDASGEEFTHSITTEHHKPDVQQAGQDELQSFVVGAGFYFQPPLPPELIGRVVVALVDENGLSWHGPRNGQPRPEPQPEANGSPPPPPADWPAWLDAERDAA